jgi:ABC-2 type transport system permease protein
MLPGVWKQIALGNPVVYLISGFRWAFYGVSDVGVGLSLAATAGFMLVCLAIVSRIFATGWKLRT